MEMIKKLLVFAVFLTLLNAQDNPTTSPPAIPYTNVQGWAEKLSTTLQTLVKTTTLYDDIKSTYENEKASYTIESVEGEAILSKAESDLSNLMKSKISSLERLYKKAEQSYARADAEGFTLAEGEEPAFYDAKEPIDNSTTPLVVVEKFHPTKEVYMNASFIHVPTDVYKYGYDIVKAINWSRALDQTFVDNYKNDSGLFWQYFGNINGMYRNYPGIAWPDPDNDLYDCRQRGWYILGSSSRKDVVILLDLSGSMIGSNLVISKLAALLLLKETLLENDFVAIVTFNKDANVLGCFEGLVQATDDNKNKLKAEIPLIEASKVADVQLGFEKAFQLLQKARNNSQSGSNCNQVINFFSDGVETGRLEQLLPVIQKYNADKKVRIFTYMIGRDTSTRDNMLKIACDNRGYFSQVETLGDVREHILMYLQVLSRPLAWANDHTAKWTPIYSDSLGTGMMTSLVMPVFSGNPSDVDQFLGVVGTDIPLIQLQRTSTPKFSLGINGYSFAINNNGFLYFHPKLKLQVGYLPVPPTIYLSEVENGGDLTNQMMNDMIGMINTTTPKQFKTFTVFSVSDDFQRAVKRNMSFYYMPVSKQSFSLAVAIPNYGLFVYKIPNDISSFKSVMLEKDGIVISNWAYCNQKSKSVAPEYDPIFMDAKELANYIKINGTAGCDNDMLRNLQLDAWVVDSAISNKWQDKLKGENGIDSIFLGTHSGMQYIQKRKTDDQEDEVVDRDAFKSYYQRAADYTNSDEGTVVFSAPYKPQGWFLTEQDENATTLITASIPIVLENKLLAAVAGMNISSEKFQTIFQENTKCEDSDCVRSCQNSEDLSCYLVDLNGYIIASNQNDTDVGQFFGVLNGFVMENLVNTSVFSSFKYQDTQAQCQVKEADKSDGNNAMRLISPLLSIPAYITWMSQTAIMSLAEFNLYSWLSSNNQVSAEDEEEEKYESCVLEYTYYNYNSSSLGNDYVGQQIDLNEADPERICKRPLGKYFVSEVGKSNLLLIVIDLDRASNDNCSPLKQQVDIKPVPALTEEDCSPNDRYRKDPVSDCYSGDEPAGDCSGGDAIKPFALFLVFICLLHWMY